VTDQGKQIKRDLEDAGWSVTDVARSLEIDISVVSSVIHGGRQSPKVREFIQCITREQYWDDVPIPESDPIR
jgi:hypothetical protein